MFQISSIIENISTRKDGTMKVVVGTQELKPEEMAKLMELYNKIGWFLFSENPLQKTDIPEEPAKEFENEKTPSERLRAVMWIYWDKNTDKSKTFDQFRKEYMEKLIQYWKDKLEV